MLKTRGFWDWVVAREARAIYTRFHKPLPTDVIVDVGAHIGSFCVPWAPQVAHIHAFEPFPENYDLLLENIALNNIENITPYEMALSNMYGMANMGSKISPLGGGTGNIFCTENCIEVPMNTMDAVIRDQVDFIKLDCEGSEIGVLEGARNILSWYHPYIAGEMHGRENLDGVLSILAEYDYQVAYYYYGWGFKWVPQWMLYAQ